MFASTEREGSRKRHQVDTIVEGMGQNRMTANIERIFDSCLSWDCQPLSSDDDGGSNHAYDVPTTSTNSNISSSSRVIDDAVSVTDREAVEMSRFVMRHDGLFLGSSSAVNLVAAVRTAKSLGPGHTVVTILCDSGLRHLTKFW